MTVKNSKFPKIHLFNSLTRKKEEFKPLNSSGVEMYTCGPTVYDYASIGNFRTYVTSDILVRVLKLNGYKVEHVMNITDVGHLTGDNLGDADIGEDRIEKSAEKQGKSAWDIAKFYTEAFLKDMKALNISVDVMPKATEHIKEQITLVQQIEQASLTYQTSDGIYFDVVEFEKKTGKKHGELSTLDQIKEGARVKKNPEKKDPRDFALWKFSPKDAKRQMEWDSPWGVGFPGWHIECSAMSMKYLGETFDIHTGGEDLRQIHHPNEIAQSEAATGKKFVNYWVHTTFLQVEGKRMGKSLGNFYTVSDVIKKGYDPRALRYLFLTAHYRDKLNFTWEAFDAASKALERLKVKSLELKAKNNSLNLKTEKSKSLMEKFLGAVNDDLNTPQAIAAMWDVVKSSIADTEKKSLIFKFDEVLGLGLSEVKSEKLKVKSGVNKLIQERDKLRAEGKWEDADDIRRKIEKMGYTLEDTSRGTDVKR